MDTSELFAMIFGSDKFEPLVGELLLASAMEEGLEPEDIIASSLGGVTAKQRKREAQCALNLAEKLAPLLVGVGLSRTESGPGGGQRSARADGKAASPRVSRSRDATRGQHRGTVNNTSRT